MAREKSPVAHDYTKSYRFHGFDPFSIFAGFVKYENLVSIFL
jgi:hypothetical protein